MDQQERREFGARLRRLRQRHALSQEGLAERVGVNRNTVGRWELGLHEPRSVELQRVCSAFGVEVSDLVPVASSDVDRRDFLHHVGVAGVAGLMGLDPASSLADLERLASSLRRQVVDDETVNHMEAISRHHSELYFRLGSLEMLELVQGHVRTTMLLQQGQMPDELRQRLAAVITEEAGRAAWHAYDLGRTATSESFYAVTEHTAKDAPAEGAYVKAYKAVVRLDGGRIREALALIEDARERGKDADPSMRAWIAAIEAQAAATAQMRARAGAALRRADRDLHEAARLPGNRGPLAIHGGMTWLDFWRLSALAGAAYERLGDGGEAARRMQPALEYLPQRSPRGQSEQLLDLAGIALLNGEGDQAVQLARESLTQARDAQSVASVDRVRRFRMRLHTLGGTPGIAALDHDLIAVTAS
jgi:transcriptional regulator with XRE-family HTH domain